MVKIYVNLKILLVVLCLILTVPISATTPLFTFSKDQDALTLESNQYQSTVLPISALDTLDFRKLQFSNQGLPKLISENDVLFSRFTLKNISNQEVFLEVAYPTIERLDLYKKLSSAEGYKFVKETGFFESHKYGDSDARSYIFSLGSDNKEYDYLLVARGRSPVFLPIGIKNKSTLLKGGSIGNVVYGVYLGIFVALILYNIFILFATRDISYLPYLFYMIFIALAQSAIMGYGNQYLWHGYPRFNLYSIPIFSSLAGVWGVIFAQVFLRVKKFFRNKWVFNVFIILEILYGLVAITTLMGKFILSYSMLNFIGVIVAVYILTIAAITAIKGYSPAIYYFLAWSVFFASLVILALRNFGILPFNNFTNNVIFIGAGGEVILLSLALADKINVFRKETQRSQAEALRVSRENEKIIREQNILLEQKVNERTLELQEANEELRVTLANLKDTQTQLVDAEKMASLGQLTAGIAHEINNPINFVTSNIGPLRRDLQEVYEIIDSYSGIREDDTEALKKAHNLLEELEYSYLKDEIEMLVNGISDGATRTSEIVKGLRTFSRLDEDAIKNASIHEGINSTLVLLNSKLKSGIEVVRDFDENLGLIECFPGKLNQVYMNILSNAIYAVNEKKYAEGETPRITIKTELLDAKAKIHINDNGIGMDENTRKKIFDPFFTTKDVGEGTGLGMSIVYKIIEKHRGALTVHSELGTGTEFIITLPLRQPNEFE